MLDTKNDEITQAEGITVQEHLEEVIELLKKHQIVENLVDHQSNADSERQDLVKNLVHKQNLNELSRKLEEMHPADIAYILEALSLDQRLVVWELVQAHQDGEILIEVSDAVRESLIAQMDEEEILAATELLDTDEIADLIPDLPENVIEELMSGLDPEELAQLKSALSYSEELVGAHMDFDILTIREDIDLDVVLRYLRIRKEIPDQTDKLFVIDRDNVLQGIVHFTTLLVHDPETTKISDIVAREIVKFEAQSPVDEAALAFERYNLISAPVVDENNRLIGRLTVDAVIDFIREDTNTEVLNLAGLTEEEDLYSGVIKSLQNRWTWLAINLVTAFIASRVIGAFEGTLEKYVALATLMPIVAGIGGNTGNQTSTLIIRAIALGQISSGNLGRLFLKELIVAILSGAVWGSVMGGVAYLLYHDIRLGIVMASAMLLNLIVAATMGLLIPISMDKFGRDPAFGSSVLLTFMTDGMGFLIFLGLATLFLIS